MVRRVAERREKMVLLVSRSGRWWGWERTPRACCGQRSWTMEMSNQESVV